MVQLCITNSYCIIPYLDSLANEIYMKLESQLILEDSEHWRPGLFKYIYFGSHEKKNLLLYNN